MAEHHEGQQPTMVHSSAAPSVQGGSVIWNSQQKC